MLLDAFCHIYKTCAAHNNRLCAILADSKKGLFDQCPAKFFMILQFLYRDVYIADADNAVIQPGLRYITFHKGHHIRHHRHDGNIIGKSQCKVCCRLEAAKNRNVHKLACCLYRRIAKAVDEDCLKAIFFSLLDQPQNIRRSQSFIILTFDRGRTGSDLIRLYFRIRLQIFAHILEHFRCQHIPCDGKQVQDLDAHCNSLLSVRLCKFKIH